MTTTSLSLDVTIDGQTYAVPIKTDGGPSPVMVTVPERAFSAATLDSYIQKDLGYLALLPVVTKEFVTIEESGAASLRGYVSMNPEPGTEVPAGSVIEIVLSKGLDPALGSPNLLGLAGSFDVSPWSLSTFKASNPNGLPDGTVVSQIPAPGTPFDTNRSIEIHRV